MKAIFKKICAGLSLFGEFLEYSRISKKRDRFKNRRNIEIEEIFARNYQGVLADKVRFVWVWNQVGRILKLDPRKLRPKDRFKVELAPVKGAEIDDEIEELEDFFLEEASALGVNVDLIDVITLNDFILKICY